MWVEKGRRKQVGGGGKKGREGVEREESRGRE